MKPLSLSKLAILATAFTYAAAAAVLPADTGTPALIARDSIANSTTALTHPPLPDLNIPGIPPFVETILSMNGIPSAPEVMAARLVKFCPRSNTNKNLCTLIQDRVYQCIDLHRECDDDFTRELLWMLVRLNPCLLVSDRKSAAYQVCDRLHTESKRCYVHTTRRPCAIGHIHYLLRHFRDLFNLKKAPAPQEFMMEEM